jgi:hypothetical protein
VLPGRLGARFALEALFLVLLAVGAGLADLRPAFIVLVMVVAWLLVALAEFTAERIARSPVSYLLPEPAQAEEEEPDRVFGPPVEERTVVAPPQSVEDTQERLAHAEPEPEPAAEPEPEPAPQPEETGLEAEAESLELPPRRRLGSFLRKAEPEAEPVAEPEPEPEPDEFPADSPSRGRFRSLLRRHEQEIEQPIPEPPPRHVKLLPRRSEPEQNPLSEEIAEVFDAGEDGEDREETAG